MQILSDMRNLEINSSFPYLLWAAECMSLRASNPQLQNTSLLLRIHTTILGSLHWNGSSEVRRGWSFYHLSNDVSILSMHLCNCTKVSDDTQHLIDLKVECSVKLSQPKSSNMCSDSLVRSIDWKDIPENQKVGKDPYKPNRPGKNWRLKIRVLVREKFKSTE